MKINFRADVDLFLLNICVKCLGKVIRNKGVKNKKSEPMNKYA